MLCFPQNQFIMNIVTVLKKTLRSGRTLCPVHPKNLRLQKTSFHFPPLTCSECLRKSQQSSARQEVLLFITLFSIITSTGAPWGSTRTSKCSPMKCSCHWPERYQFGSCQTIKAVSQNHRVVGVGRDLWRTTPLPKQVHPEQVAQDHLQGGF